MDRRVLGGGAIVCSALVLWSQPSAPESQQDCDEGEGLATCTTRQARQQPQTSILPPEINRAIESLPIEWGGRTGAEQLPDSMENLYADLLAQAQAAASENKLAIALTTVSGIPNNSEHHSKAKQLQESWAQALLERGNSHYQQGDVDAALSMLNAIPPTSDRFERAQELQIRWNQQAALLDQAKSAREAEDWQSVLAAIESLEGTPLYDSQPVQQLLQQAIYRAYRSGESLMQLAAPAANTSAIAAIPTTQAASEAPPDLPDLPIDVDQAMAWAQPSPPVVALPAPMPMPIAPSVSRPAAIAQQPAAPPAAIAPPESLADTSIDKTPADHRSRPSLSDRPVQIDPKSTK